MKTIILEGPDGAGKSTLGDQIAAHLGIEVSHDGGPSRDREHALERIHALNGYDRTLRDRSTLFSDGVYKKALGITPFVSDEEINNLVADYAKKRPLVIYCRPSMDVIFRNIGALDRVKAHKPPEYIEKLKVRLPLIVEQYDKSMLRWISLGLNVIVYDYTRMKIEDLLSAIEFYWND